MLILRFVKSATPLTARTVVVPSSLAPAGPLAIDSVTSWVLLVVIVLPFASTTSTVIAGLIGWPTTASLGWPWMSTPAGGETIGGEPAFTMVAIGPIGAVIGTENKIQSWFSPPLGGHESTPLVSKNFPKMLYCVSSSV